MKDEITKILSGTFPAKQVNSFIEYYISSVDKYQQGDWETSILKSGKFVESVIKSLVIYTGNTLPKERDFSVNSSIIKLGQLDKTLYDDTVRLTIPRACIFIYDIASNRGARHDSDKFSASKMDSSVLIPIMSWIISEMLRFIGKINDDSDVMIMTDILMEKKHPIIENIDGRIYVNRKGLVSKDIALLILYSVYPKRMNREELSESVERHGNDSKKNISVSITRIKDLIDDDGNNNWKLREIGREKAERILSSISD